MSPTLPPTARDDLRAELAACLTEADMLAVLRQHGAPVIHLIIEAFDAAADYIEVPDVPYWARFLALLNEDILKLYREAGGTRGLPMLPCGADVIVAYRRLGAAAVDAWIAALGSASYALRVQAVIILGRLGDRRAVPALIECLRKPERPTHWRPGYDGMTALGTRIRELEAIVEYAAIGAGALGDARAVPALLALLGEHPRWGMAAEAALLSIGDLSPEQQFAMQQAVDAELTVSHRRSGADEFRVSCERIAAAAAPPVAPAYQWSLPPRSWTAMATWEAAQPLNQTSIRGYTPAARAEDTDPLPGDNQPDATAVESLIQALSADPSPDVRAGAVETLGAIGDPRALDALRLAREGDDGEAGRSACHLYEGEYGTVAGEASAAIVRILRRAAAQP